MKGLARISIKNRMIFSFSVVIFFLIIFGVVSIYEMKQLSDLTSILYHHPLQVSNAALNARSGLLKMDGSMKDVLYTKSERAFNEALATIRRREDRVIYHLDIIKKWILGEEGKALEEETRRAFYDWKFIRDDIIENKMKGNFENAEMINRIKGEKHVRNLEIRMKDLTDYARNKADGFMDNADSVAEQILYSTLGFILGISVISIFIAFFLSSSILTSISRLKDTMSEISKSGRLTKAEIHGNNEITEMSKDFNILIEKLKDLLWRRDTITTLNNKLSGGLDINELAEKSISIISRAVDACTGAVYLCESKDSLCRLTASYSFVERKHLSGSFNKGEGIVGQVAVEKKPILLTHITRDDALGVTGTLSEAPKSIYAVPLIYEDELYGVMETAVFNEFTEIQKEFVNDGADIISTALYSSIQNKKIQDLYNKTQEANDELENQKKALENQSDELMALNREFRRQTLELQDQNKELDEQRSRVEEADRLKSEFLSNMSHELRTPLNSVMALSKVLIMQAGNKLSDEEVKYLNIIERNGDKLLKLINEILDLSKIESGHMEVSLGLFNLKDVVDDIIENIEPLSREKGIELKSLIRDDIPEIESDEAKVHQILQNIIGNAVKFTQEGSVVVSSDVNENDIHIIVRDTGIGIPAGDIPYIFKEFRQVDGSASRNFEGTGLGLAIAYKSIKLLGGDITVESELGKGATFTIVFPKKKGKNFIGKKAVISKPPSFSREGNDLKTVLVVDDEPAAAALIADHLRNHGFKAVIATEGQKAVKLAEKYQPDAITLDVMMPDADGWEVLQHLKKNPKTSHIPVIMITISQDKEIGFALGAVGYVAKPVDAKALVSEINKTYTSKISNIMIVDDDDFDRKTAASILEKAGFKTIEASGGKECLKMMRESMPDAMLLDLMMPDMDGFQVLDSVRKIPETMDLPVIILTAKDLTLKDKKNLEGKTSVIIEKDGTDSDMLLRRIMEFIDAVNGKKTPLNNDFHAGDKILLVEDNEAAVIQVKNALKNTGLHVDVARNGEEALKYMRDNLPKGIVLDLMMPGVDGFEVLENLRSTEKTKEIPVLVLTAKDVTKDDMKRLSANNIRQLIQKGDVDRLEFIEEIQKMLKSADEKKTTAPKLLVIEDNPDNLETVKAVLKNNYDIKEAFDGETGLDVLSVYTPDLVLLDISLPGMDGFEVLAHVKKDERLSRIPIVALTARAMKGDREAVINAGFDEYVSKPIDPERLIAAVKKEIKKGY